MKDFPSLSRGVRAVFLAPLISLALTQSLSGFTKTGATYATDGSQSDVSAAIAAAVNGEVVSIPAGTFTWGAGGTFILIDKNITLVGAGPSNTTINISPTAPAGTNATIRISAAATVRDFTINGSTADTPPFSTSPADGWRISNITSVPGGGAPYFCFFNGGYGLIDNCHITGAAGNNELIFGRGRLDSWQTPSSLGGADNLFIEDCIFNGPGYVCDANSNSRVVVRYCTINGVMKIDGHGSASNGPPRSVRHMEVYGNTWTSTSEFFTAIEMRGGTGFLFDNTTVNNDAGHNWFYLTDYGYMAPWPNFGNTYQTPINYPVVDQIGVGKDPKVAASEPMYLWNNRAKAGADWTLTWKIIDAAANSLYATQTGNPGATFIMEDVIKADREYFKHTVGGTFNGSSGVGRGTKAQMLAIAPTKTGVGFWVTDEGEWNSLQAGADGQLYVWNGSAWVLKYTPYTYPHPLRRPNPPTNLRFVP